LDESTPDTDTDSDWPGEPYELKTYDTILQDLRQPVMPVSQHSQIKVGHADSNSGGGMAGLDSLELRQVIPV